MVHDAGNLHHRQRCFLFLQFTVCVPTGIEPCRHPHHCFLSLLCRRERPDETMLRMGGVFRWSHQAEQPEPTGVALRDFSHETRHGASCCERLRPYLATPVLSRSDIVLHVWWKQQTPQEKEKDKRKQGRNV